MPEVHGHAAAQHDADDAEDGAKSAEKRQRLVFANHAEDGAHHLDAVAHGVEFADGAFWAIAVLDRHLVEAQVVVQRVDGHLGLNLEAARQHGVGFDEGEREGTVAGHDVGDVGVEQAVDRTAHQTVTEVVERALVLLEVGGAQAVADYHVVAFEHLIHHDGRRVCRIGVIAIRHDVHVGVDVFEHGANHVAFALARFLADDCALAGRDFRRAVGGVVVIHVNVGARQCCLEITHYLADGDFLVIARQQYGNGGACILLEHVEHYSLCCGRSEASCGFNYDCCLLGKGYERMA